MMTVKERIKATIAHEEVDHLPLCVDTLCHGWVKFINERYPGPFERALFYRELGLDTGIMLYYPAGEVYPSENIFEQSAEPQLKLPTREWKEEMEDGSLMLLKEYQTSAGELRQVVKKTEDYYM